MLRFGVLGIPVRVHASFLLVALLGIGVFEAVELVVWTVAVFFAVLAHELGHALTARAYGAAATVTLFALGGITTWDARHRLTPLRRMVVAAAGSGVGVSLGTMFLVAARVGWFGTLTGLPRVAVISFIWASLVWGLLNWIPIRQLDGGHIVESVLEAVVPNRAAAIARAVSMISGTIAAGAAFYFGWYLAGVFAVVLTLADLTASRRSPEAAPAEVGDADGEPTARNDAGPEPGFPI